ncbi:gamma-mobile-trio integrase GmtZ [Sphingosinicella humi]|nr:VPA1269 family protein [Sphingosinicella humi]
MPHIKAILDDFKAHDDKASGTNKSPLNRYRGLIDVLISTQGVQEVGDLTPEVYRLCLEGRKINTNTHRSLPRLIIAAMTRAYGQTAVTSTVTDYVGWVRPVSKKQDVRFEWVVKREPEMEAWRSASEEWFAQRQRSRNGALSALTVFLEHLLDDSRLPREPIEYLRGTTWARSDIKPFRAEVERNTRNAHSFLEWLIVTRCVEEGEDGHPYILPGFRNPIIISGERRQNLPETYREAMPTKYVTLLKEILTADDAATPKVIGRSKLGWKGGDWLNWFDEQLGCYVEVWSPVRNSAILLKLETPLRTFQVRMLNSGEADRSRFNIATGKWEENSHELAGEADPPKGVIRRRGDDLCLYINTNKTADVGRRDQERGYEIPWNHEPVVRLLDELRQWQEKYNPVSHQTQWQDLAARELMIRHTAEALAARGAETFLFRDPCSEHRDQPVTDGRLRSYWIKLLTELERRLRDMGIEDKLILSRRADGAPSAVAYDLHSLRVTWITAMAEKGVDLAILMKVAGHCTAIMTAYYQKHSIGHISRVLNSASAEMQARQQEGWEAHLKSKAYDELKSAIAYNDVDAVDAAAKGARASWVRIDYGICPVGCMRCHEGGPLLHRRADGYTVHGPVPGPGSKNCVRCRFFMSGPAFLIGLHARFNEVGFRFREASRRYKEAQREFEQLDHLRVQAAQTGSIFDKVKQWDTASAVLDQRTNEADDWALTWHATYNLIMQCQQLLRGSDGGGAERNVSLITLGSAEDLEFVVELDDRGEREFELIDNVCQAAVFYQSIDASVPNLKRLRMFDAFLARAGLEALFLHISEEDGLRIANELAKFMYTQFGRDETNALMAGERLLQSLGYEEQTAFRAKLEGLTGTRLSRRGQNLLIEQTATEAAE